MAPLGATDYIIKVGLGGCETSTLTLREECRLRVFQSKILRQIFGPKRDANGEWRSSTMRNFIHSLYRSPIIVRVIKSGKLKWVGHVARMEEEQEGFQNFNR